MSATILVTFSEYSGVPHVHATHESQPLFMFVTGGCIAVSRERWETEIEPVLKALGWWWRPAAG